MVSRIWLFYSLSQRTIFNLKPDPVSPLVEFSRRSFSRRQSSLHEDLSTSKSRPVQRFVVTKWYQRIPSGSRNLRTGGSNCRSPTWWIYYDNLLWNSVSEPKTIKFIEKVFPWLHFANIKLANRFSSSISVIQKALEYRGHYSQAIRHCLGSQWRSFFHLVAKLIQAVGTIYRVTRRAVLRIDLVGWELLFTIRGKLLTQKTLNYFYQ